MPSTSASLAVGGPPMALNLGFGALSVRVDNLTPDYVSIPDSGQYPVPPWTYGAVLSLPPGVKWGNASLLSVPLPPQGPAVPVVQATLTWYDIALPPDPGHLLAQSSYVQQQVLDNFTFPAGGGSYDRTFALPAGTQAVGIHAITAVTTDDLTIFGVPSDALIVGSNETTVLFSGQIYGAPTTTDDTSIRVEYTSSSAAQFAVLAWQQSPFVFTAPSPAAEPSARQVAGSSAPVGVAIANGATSTVIAAPTLPGAFLSIITVALAPDSAAPGSDLLLEETVTGKVLGRVSCASTNPPAQPWAGRPLTQANGLRLRADGSDITVRGTIVYS